jgi:DNA-binding MarR family transcriptional regulator
MGGFLVNTRQIDELLGTPARLAIVATLAQVDSLSFTQLGQEAGLADGNLHVQTRKLMAAGYIVGVQGRKGNRKVTCFSLTTLGREMLRKLVNQLAEAAGMQAMGHLGLAERSRPRSPRSKDDSQVW